MPKHVLVSKDGATLAVHEKAVADHQRIGWVVEPVQPDFDTAAADITPDDAAPAKAAAVPDDWASQHWAKQVQIAEALTGGDLIPAEGETKAEAARRVIGEHLAAQGV